LWRKRHYGEGGWAWDLWFPQDMARNPASIHETMAASMCAAPPLNPEMAEAYQRGFVDALRAVALAFGIAVPGRESQIVQTIVRVEAQQSGFRSLEAGKWR
jgi:hypothetical protein